VRLLLDTHVWLWTLVSPERFRDPIRELLVDRQNELLFSAASAWEIAIKFRLGKLPLPEPPARFVPPRLARDGITTLPVEPHHALHVADLPDHHRDPFDRLLVSQAMLEDVILVTADQQLTAYDAEVLLV
jgi:PIN domain nuclease of toxin-antitoxin system